MWSTPELKIMAAQPISVSSARRRLLPENNTPQGDVIPRRWRKDLNCVMRAFSFAQILLLGLGDPSQNLTFQQWQRQCAAPQDDVMKCSDVEVFAEFFLGLFA